MATESVVKKITEQGIKQVEVNIKGVGSGRDSAIRVIQSYSLIVTVIRDLTFIPHNGCRPKKKRRV